LIIVALLTGGFFFVNAAASGGRGATFARLPCNLVICPKILIATQYLTVAGRVGRLGATGSDAPLSPPPSGRSG
jgi:hypothetical protein